MPLQELEDQIWHHCTLNSGQVRPRQGSQEGGGGQNGCVPGWWGGWEAWEGGTGLDLGSGQDPSHRLDPNPTPGQSSPGLLDLQQ